MADPLLTAEAFEELATRGVPYVGQLGCRVERFERGRVEVRLPYQELLLRPGGTVCGPALFAGDLVGHGRILRLGRVLAVGEVTVRSVAGDEAVAHAVGTYAIPATHPTAPRREP